MPYKTSVVQPTPSTNSSDSTSVGGDGILFALMLAVVAGIFLFKGNKGIANTNTLVDDVTESKPITGIPIIQQQQVFETSRFEDGVNAQCPMPNTQWVQNLVKQTALIWGNQGGGKSWLVRYVIKLKVELGYKVIVLDPDSNRSEWKGVESYHSWEDIEKQIVKYVDELRSRLEKFNNSTMSEAEWRKSLWDDGKAIALICEEATTYGDFIKNESLLEMFGKLALTKSRKQEMPVTIISHNNTQTCMFGIKGFYNLVSKMLQVECLAEVDPITLQPKSKGLARVKLDSSIDWLLVDLPKMEAKISEFKSDSKPNLPIYPKGDIELTATSALPEPMRTIWRVVQKEGNWLTAREIARKEYAALKGKNTASEIVAVIQQLESIGLVEVNNEGQAIRFRAATLKEL